MTGQRKILVVSYAGHSLIKPSLRLATHLLKMGASVTFSTSSRVIQSIDKEITPAGLAFAPFSVAHDDHITTLQQHFSDFTPFSAGEQPPTTLQQHISDFATHGACAIAEIITSAAAKGEPFDHLVYTPLIPWAGRVADAQNVKSTLFWCQPGTALGLYYHHLYGFEELSPVDQNNPLLRFSPSTPKEQDFLLPVYKDHLDVLKTAPRILVCSYYEPESDSIKNFEFGPLNEKDSYGIPDDSYVDWLNTTPIKSVGFAEFEGVTRSDEAEEIAAGSLDIGYEFLWVTRGHYEAKPKLLLNFIE